MTTLRYGLPFYSEQELKCLNSACFVLDKDIDKQQKRLTEGLNLTLHDERSGKGGSSNPAAKLLPDAPARLRN